MRYTPAIAIFACFGFWGCQEPAQTPPDVETSAARLIDPESMFAQTHLFASCEGSEPVACGEIATDQCSEDVSQFSASDYACIATSIDLDGGEWIQPFVADASGNIGLSLGRATDYAFVAILRNTGGAPSASDCIVGAASWYGLDFSSDLFEPGEQLWVVVDHPAGSSLAFDMRVDCPKHATEGDCEDGLDEDIDYLYDCADPDCHGSATCPVCSPAHALAMGDIRVAGNTASFGHTSHVTNYTACLGSLQPTGNEVAYTFQPTETERVVVNTTNFSGYPVVTVVKDQGNGCLVSDCLGSSYYSLVFEAEAGETYYIIVDSEDASITYDISLTRAEEGEATCDNGLDDDGDLLVDCNDPSCLYHAACATNVCEAVDTLDCDSRWIAGSTSSPEASAQINEYSCMPTLGLALPEVAYRFRYDDGPAEQEVVFSLSELTNYAIVAILNDVNVVEMDVQVTNDSNKRWTQGLLSTTSLLDPGPTPQPGANTFHSYAFAHRLCDQGGEDDGDAVLLAERWGLELGKDAWVIPALDPGESAVQRVTAPADKSLSFIARIQGSRDDVVMMHQPGDPTATGVPLSDEQGTAFDNIVFEISGYDVDSASATNGNGSSCSSYCPASSNCFVSFNNGTTGGSQSGDALGSEVQCNPKQCVTGNFWNGRFTAQRGVEYYVTVEGWGSHVDYNLNVVCDPPAEEQNCNDGIDEDGDLLWDCNDPDCIEACSGEDACNPTETIDCDTTLLSGDTNDANATDVIDTYPLTPGLVQEGAEFTYQFTPPVDGHYNFTTSDISDYATIAVFEDLGVCDPIHQVGIQFYSTVVYLEAEKNYFVVVDGQGATGDTMSYKLSVVCDPPVSEVDCSDNIDNDGDRLTDCYDPDCGC